jgi:hypothetical protein
MGIGTILNINPKGALKASATVATAATKTLTHMVQKEAVDVAAAVASKNVSKATPWFKSFNPYQVTQKTSQVAEKYIAKEGVEKLNLNAIKKLSEEFEIFLGKNPILSKPQKGFDLILRSKDGCKQIRFDLNNPHGLDPHINIETFTSRNLYPGDSRMIQTENIHVFPRKI